jgi:hypothetical protein
MRRAFVEGFLAPRREAATAVYLRGVAEGVFRPDIDADLAIDTLYGPLYYRILTTGDAIDEVFIARLCDLVLSNLTAQPAR